jgi:hypothetical protein
MTQDEIIAMARQAGFNVSGEWILDDMGYVTMTNRLDAFAKLVADKAIAELESQEPVVLWPCHIIQADFHKKTITLGMECGDYKVSAGKHWLSTNPPQENKQ